MVRWLEVVFWIFRNPKLHSILGGMNYRFSKIYLFSLYIPKYIKNICTYNNFYEFKDYITYSVILIGLFSLPTSNTQMECTLTNENDTSKVAIYLFSLKLILIWLKPKWFLSQFFLQISPTYVNKYCTAEVMTLFSSYFPYILILGPTILVAIEKYFSRYIFKKTVILYYMISLVFKKNLCLISITEPQPDKWRQDNSTGWLLKQLWPMKN